MTFGQVFRHYVAWLAFVVVAAFVITDALMRL